MDANLLAPQRKDITQLISNDLAGYRQLLELLTEERQLLVKREFEAYTRLLADKNELLTVLDQNSQRRVELLAKFDLPVDKKGLKTLFEGLEAEEAELAERDWCLIKDLINECTHLNDVNARITHRAQATTHHILKILRGDQGELSLYGKNGIRDERGKHLPITQA